MKRRGQHLAAVAAAAAVLAAGVTTAVLWPSAGPAEPHTAAAASATAGKMLSYYASRQFGRAWDLLTPGWQQAVPRRTWSGFYDRCPAAPARYAVDAAELAAGNSALVTVTLAMGPVRAGDISPGYPLILTFYYMDGTWRYAPDKPPVKPGATVDQDLAAARAAGVC